MPALTIQDTVEAGLAASYEAADAGGDTAQNKGGDVVLHIKNTNAATRTVTVTAQVSSQDVPSLGAMTKANASVVVPATTGERFLGPFPQGAFNDANGNVAITYDAVADLTIAALRVPKA